MRHKQVIQYKEKIKKAIEQMKLRELESAKLTLYEAMPLDDNGTEVQNLLGLYFELMGDRLFALRHYRAAYALDPSNIYASKNIERLTYGDFIEVVEVPLFGDELIEFE